MCEPDFAWPASSVVLLSGGMDSAAVFTLARQSKARQVHALFVDYGQPAVEPERKAARELHRHLEGDGFHEVTVHGLCTGDMVLDAGEESPRVVPARNLVLAGLGVNLASSLGAEAVILGVTRGDHADYIDCRPLFYAAMAPLVSQLDVAVMTPLIKEPKSYAYWVLRSGGVPPEMTWSCYTPVGGEPCGSCNSCKLRSDLWED